jgi:hypothetical protein
VRIKEIGTVVEETPDHDRGTRVLYISDSIGLGHARRDLAIARELRRLDPGILGLRPLSILSVWHDHLDAPFVKLGIEHI